MKIVAQSVVPPKPTYLHLAYIAATTADHTAAMTLASLVITLLIIVYQRQFKPKVWKPLLTLGIGGLITAGIALQPVTYQHPQMLSYIRARRLLTVIGRHYEKSERIPISIGEMKTKWKLDDEMTQDAWKHNLRVVDYPQNKDLPYRVFSAGADGNFSTEDDISYPILKKNSGGVR